MYPSCLASMPHLSHIVACSAVTLILLYPASQQHCQSPHMSTLVSWEQRQASLAQILAELRELAKLKSFRPHRQAESFACDGQQQHLGMLCATAVLSVLKACQQQSPGMTVQTLFRPQK